jgi:hypothetical protein
MICDQLRLNCVVSKRTKSEDSKAARVSIDVSDLRTRIENCRTGDDWDEIPFSIKVRIVLKRGLEQIEQEKKIGEK